MKKLLMGVVAALMISPFAQAAVIDSMDSLSGWSSESDSGSFLTVSLDNGTVKMNYSFGTGEWAQIGKDFSSVNLSAGDSVKFFYKGSGTNDDLTVRITDSDGSIFAKTISLAAAQTSWTQAVLRFSGAAPDFTYSSGGDNLLDRTKIKKIGFEISRNSGGTGTIAIDEVGLYLSSPTVRVLDNFDDGDDNNVFGGTNGGFDDTVSTCTRSYSITEYYSGSRSAKIDYNVNSGSYSGFKCALNSVDISDTYYLTFMVKGSAGGEKFYVKLGGSTDELSVSNYASITTSWQQVTIPISDFTNFYSTGTAGAEFGVVFKNSLGSPYSGTIYIDEVKFAQTSAVSYDVSSLDAMEDDPNSLGAWNLSGAGAGSLKSASGYSGNAVELGFELSGGPVLMERDLSPNVAQATVFKFKYKGTGASDNIEFKISDSDNTVYRKTLVGVADTDSEWKTAEIPITELVFFDSGTDKELDLKAIKKIWISIAKNSGSAGTLWIDGLEFAAKPASEFTGNSVLDDLSVPYNPISPDGDGIKDRARFVYKLKESATVKLEIYALKGRLLKAFDEGEKAPNTEYTIEWSADDEDGNRVSNGIYIYKFTAKGSSGEDKITHVIGVIR